MSDLTKLTTDELLFPLRCIPAVPFEHHAEIRRRLERLEKCEAAMQALAPMIGCLGRKETVFHADTLVCEYCNGTDEDNSAEIVRHLATCPALIFRAALEDR